MKSFLSLSLLASVAAFAPAAEPSPEDAARFAVALLLAQRQAPVAPQAPAAPWNPWTGTRESCNCGWESLYPSPCSCTPGTCTCGVEGRPCPTARLVPPVLTGKPVVQLLILSRHDCPPCAALKAELHVNGQADAFPRWDVFTDSPDLNAKYGVTAFPTIILLKGGKEVSRHVGYMSAADMLLWRDNLDAPQSRGESVQAATYAVVQPTYQPMPMRWAAAACGT